MEGLEFYMFEDELWCKTSDGKNFIVDETHTWLVKYILEKVRACYPEAYEALEKIYSKSAPNESYYQYLMMRRFANATFVDSTLQLLMLSMLTRMESSTSRRSNVPCVVNVLMKVSYVCQGLMLIFLLRSCV